MQKRQRKSPQRELILKLLSKPFGHATAEQLFEAARKKMPKISLGTVYRNLGALEAAGEIMSTLGPKNLTYYELAQEPHHHFICERCHSIKNLEEPGVQMCVSCIEKKSDFKINKVFTNIYGSCNKCMINNL